MSRFKVLLGLAAALSALVVIGGAMPVVSQQPAERQTLSFFDPNKTNYDRFLNEGKRGISPGDIIMFIEKQLDPETCENVGRLVGKLQIVKTVGTEDAIYDGGFTMLLGDGKITAAAAARFSEFSGTDPVFAVTGGTGAYRDASGDVTFQENVELCEKKGDLVTIDIGPRP